MKNIEDYPITMTAKDVSQILGISPRVAYDIMEAEDFPLIRIGRHKKVHRDKFFQWMDQKASQNSKTS
jgi:predicted DNA-binding transcriptional regulator AlpA